MSSKDGLYFVVHNNMSSSSAKMEQCECCQRFFESDAFEHQNDGCIIEGINACIHCYIGINLDKFSNNSQLLLNCNEKNNLQRYKNIFAKGHQTAQCSNTKMYGKCLLCEYLNINMSNLNGNNISDLIDESIDDKNDDGNDNSVGDVTLVKQHNTHKYTLSL